MAIYQKGKDTKEKIYLAAKKLFYENGYKKTTLEKIAKIADVPVGLVHYYYKKKSDLITDIYFDFIKSVLSTINNQVSDEIENSLVRHTLMSNIFYTIIYNDEKNKMVFSEIISLNLPKEKNLLVRKDLMNTIFEFNLDISEEFFNHCMMAEYGARREILINNHQHLTLSNLNNTINFIASIVPRLAGISNEEIDNILKKSKKILNKIDYSNIKFLI